MEHLLDVSVRQSTVDFWDFRVAAGTTFELVQCMPIIPQDELWLYQDRETLSTVMRGLAEAAEGKGRVLPFAQYANGE